MGRKKAEDNTSSVDISKSKFVTNNITKDFGNVILSGDALFGRKKRIIPIYPSLDLALGGGIPEGSWVVINGPAKYGKTSALLELAQNAQQKEYGEKDVYYIDVEARLKPMNLNSYKLLKPEKFHHIVSQKGEQPLTAEQFLNIAEQIALSHPDCLIIFDSVSALCEQRQREGGVGTETRGGGAKLIAQFCTQMAQVVSVNDIILCCVTHSMANTSGYGASLIEKTANALKYQVDVKLRAIKQEFYYAAAKEDKPIGQKTQWVVDCSALGMPPGQQVGVYLRYGQGLDKIYDFIDLGVSLGLIVSAEGGGWLTLNLDEEVKQQGKEKMRNYLLDNQKTLIQLQNKIKSVLS